MPHIEVIMSICDSCSNRGAKLPTEFDRLQATICRPPLELATPGAMRKTAPFMLGLRRLTLLVCAAQLVLRTICAKQHEKSRDSIPPSNTREWFSGNPRITRADGALNDGVTWDDCAFHAAPGLIRRFVAQYFFGKSDKVAL